MSKTLFVVIIIIFSLANICPFRLQFPFSFAFEGHQLFAFCFFVFVCFCFCFFVCVDKSLNFCGKKTNNTKQRPRQAQTTKPGENRDS